VSTGWRGMILRRKVCGSGLGGGHPCQTLGGLRILLILMKRTVLPGQSLSMVQKTAGMGGTAHPAVII